MDANADLSGETSRQSDAVETGEWVSIDDAAARLRVTTRTLYRRLSRGYLQRRTGADGRLEVWVAVTSSADVSPDTSRQAETGDQAERAIILAERLNLAVAQQVSPILEQLAAAHATIREQAEELGRLRERLDHVERERRDMSPEPSRHPNHLEESPPCPWWAFWRRGSQSQP
jgi:hypothetical protein